MLRILYKMSAKEAIKTLKDFNDGRKKVPISPKDEGMDELVDAVHVLKMTCAFYEFQEGKMILAYIVYAIVGLWILGTGAVFFSAWLEDRKGKK